MSHKFSQQLRSDCIKHFDLKYGQKINNAQADEFLNSLADLVDILARPMLRK